MRTLSLAQEWVAAGGRAGLYGEGTALLANGGGVEVYGREPWRAGSREDGARTAKEAHNRAASWLVIDGYGFDGPFQEELTGAGCPALLIADHSWPVGSTVSAVLNQNIDAQAAYYDVEPGVDLLLGPEFALIRREFAKVRACSRALAPTGWRVLVSMGGADPTQATEVVLMALWQIPTPLEVVVVVGAANLRGPEIAEAAAGLQAARQDISVRVISASKSLAELMAWADLAIVAGGSTVWELMCVGTPGVIVVVAENQVLACLEIRRRSLGVVVDGRSGFGPTELRDAIGKLLSDPLLRAELRERGMRVVDGHGAARVLERIALRL